jgi:hypothetical protein
MRFRQLGPNNHYRMVNLSLFFVIGLGTMASQTALRLAMKGHKVTIFNRDRFKAWLSWCGMLSCEEVTTMHPNGAFTTVTNRKMAIIHFRLS